MRGRLALVTLAVTTLIVVSFVVPLGIVAKRQAEARALTSAETQARSIATALSVTASLTPGPVTVEAGTAILTAFGAPATVSIHLPDGQVLGQGAPDDQAVQAAKSGVAFTAATDDGAAVLVPIITGEQTTVVRVAVPAAELLAGVTTAWVVLASLALALIGIALVAADRLGRSIVRPAAELREAATRLGQGDLTTRVAPDGPPEIREIGHTFNDLSRRLHGLLLAEREAAADISHGLRTPLMALRLQLEALRAGEERTALLTDMDELEAAVDRVIEEARAATEPAKPTDLVTLTRRRVEFWEPLAADQGREITAVLPPEPVVVLASPTEIGKLIDTLIENVFSHTDRGTAMAIRVEADGTLVVADAGTGFDPDAVPRGRSMAGSTGLGLDIVRRTAERTGGGSKVSRSELGGAAVTVSLPLVRQ